MAMTMSMAPPAFSLRVKLYSTNAHSTTDQPLRSFRVLTTPELTVGEFCEQVSKFHQANYGEPIAIKKCQDEEGFDITQGDIIGELFINIATIRVIQAVANPGVRDSVPPTSKLRYDPPSHTGRKREREAGARPDDSPSSSAFRFNKRQRVTDLDPDQPLPSRETELDAGGTINEEDEPREEIIPNSQREAAHGQKNGTSPYVREEPRISETPSPPPELPDTALFENGLADRQGRKFNVKDRNEPLTSKMSIQSPSEPAAFRAQNAARSKSASYHIQRATERGTSISTAATSPLSGDQQGATTNGTRTVNQRKISDTVSEAPKTNGYGSPRSPNVDSLYDNIPSESEKSSVLRRTKDKLKPKSGSPSGLPGLDWMKKFDTPPNGSRRKSCSQDRVLSKGELPLTPSSKERAEKQQRNEHANDAKVAAARAAEQRAADERERTRQLQEKSKRDAQEKRDAMKAGRLENDRLDKLERKRLLDAQRKAEEGIREQQRLREAVELAELERKKQAAITREQKERERLQKEKQEGREDISMLEREKAEAEAALCAREEGTKRRANETASAVEAMREPRKLSYQYIASTPDRSKATSIRPQASSTAFIPSGRKPALKAAARSSSPILARTVSAGSSSQADLPPPSETKRRVSFADDNLKEAPKSTPNAAARPAILPPPRNLAFKSPSSTTPKPAPKLAPKSAPKPSTVPVVRQSTTPIPPPPFLKHGSEERSTSHLVQPTTSPSQSGAAARPAATKVPPPATKSILPSARSISRELSNGSLRSKVSTKSAFPRQVQASVSSEEESGEEDESQAEVEEDQEMMDHDYTDDGADDDEDEEDKVEENEEDKDLDTPGRMDPVEALNSSIRSPRKRDVELESESASQDEEEDSDVEMQDIQSNRSSSRSPIHFNSHTMPSKPEYAQTIKLASSMSDASNDEDESLDEDKSADGEEESSDEEDDEDDEDKTITAVPPRYSSHPLPVSRPTAGVSSNSKPSQPSSAARKITPVPVPSSSAARPKFSIGASLSDMNAKKLTLASSSQANTKARPLKLAEDDGSEEESEEDSDSDSDNEKEPSQILPKMNQPRLSKSSNSDSDEEASDSESDAGSDEENSELQKHQNNLLELISKMASESQVSTQSYDESSSPKLMKNSQSSTSSGKEKASSRKSEKHRVFQFAKPR